MTNLNLPALSGLHVVRRMWMRGRHREDLCGHCRMVYPCPTRQLLDMVDRMGKALEALADKHFDWPQDGEEDVLADYRRAKGSDD